MTDVFSVLSTAVLPWVGEERRSIFILDSTALYSLLRQ